MQFRMILKQWGGYGVAIAGMIWLLYSGPGWYHLLRLRKQVYTLRRAVTALECERDALRERVARFDVNEQPARARFAHERHVREVLHLGRPNEIVYRY